MFKELYNKIKEWIMSLFIGDDNSGNPIVHMTSGTTTESSMKSGVNTSTIFHSSLPYLQQLHYEVVPFTEVNTGGQYSYASRSVTLSNAIIDYINAGYAFIVVVNTANSGGVNIALPVASSFTKTGAPLVSKQTYSKSGYSYGSTPYPYQWSSFPDVPSYTNKYMALENPLASIDSILLTTTSSTYGTKDVVYSAYVIVYDMNEDGVISLNNGTNSISVSNNEFKISSTSYGEIDLANFKPARVSSAANSLTYRSYSSNINVLAYVGTASAPVSWNMNTVNSSAPIIAKTGANNVTEYVASASVQNLVNYSTVSTTYSVTSSKNSYGYYTTPVTIPEGHVVCVVNNGTFSNATYSGAITYGKAFFIGNGGSSLLVNGYTYRSKNGVEYFADWYLYVYIESNTVKIKSYANNRTSQAVDTGTFTGTLKILMFKY